MSTTILTARNRPTAKAQLVKCLVPLLFLTNGCRQETPPEEQVIRPVRFTEAYSAGSDRARTFAGTAKAASEQTLSFRVGGTVSEVGVEVGDRIREGDLIARIDAGDFELQRDQSEATLAQAQAEARNAQASYERTLALYENRNASLSDLDAARALYESANATVQSARTGLRLSEQQVEYTRLIAPINGLVAQVFVDVNENVNGGSSIVLVTSDGLPEVNVGVPEALIGRVQADSPVEVSFSALPNQRFSARVSEVGVATAAGGTFLVTVRLSQEEERIRPGMAAEVTLTFVGEGGEGDHMIIPPEAVTQDQNGRFVFVLQASTGDLAIAERRNVEVGVLLSQGIEIISGLSDGDLIATAGLRTLTDGQTVRLLEGG